MIENQQYKVKGMHCASCSSIIEKTLKKQLGVLDAQVNYGTETASISFDANKTHAEKFSKTIEPLGYALVVENAPNLTSVADAGKNQKLADLAVMKRHVYVLLPLAVISIFFMGWEILSQLDVISAMPTDWYEFFHHLIPLLATYALFVVGNPYLKGVYRFLRFGKANMDTLIGIGTLAAYFYSFVLTALEEPLRQYLDVSHDYFDVTIVVITFITLGKYLEMRAKLKTGNAIEKLLNLQAKTALVLRNGQEVELPMSEVVQGDHIIVKPGTKVPVDGVIIDGCSFIDESMVTGEPMPIEKKVGADLIGGTLNTNSTVTMQATKVGSETLLAHIVKMVEQAQGSKAPIQGLADKISGIFVPIVLLLAVATLLTWLIVGTPYLGFAQALSFGLVSFVSILVIACPCALGLATPTAIIVGVGKGASEGILIKDAATLEKLHTINTVVVDKTGTITKGKPELISIEKYVDMSEEKVVSLIASLEKLSEHPIAHAIVNYATEKKIQIQKVEAFENIKGKGIKGTIEGSEYYAGNERLLNELGVIFESSVIQEATSQGRTPVILATQKEVLAVVFVADALKETAVKAVADLHAAGIKVVMLTGDNKNTAAYIAKQVGIDDFFAEVLPEDKLNKIKELQSKGNIVAMAGDGVNDAPALAQADVGIAMGTGTDVAIESAGITLLHGDISKLVKAVRLSALTMRGIKQNLFWAFIYNVIGIPIAAGIFYPIFGWLLSPVFAGLAMAFSSVSVVTNSLRLKAKKL